MEVTRLIADENWNPPYTKAGAEIFVCHSSFQEKDTPKNAQFRWNPRKKKWWTDDPEKAARLAEWADPSCREYLEEIRMKNIKAVEASQAKTADIEIPVPEGCEYYPFQKAGIAYSNGRDSVLLGDEMGLGKTPQTAGIINCDDSIKTVLIICPASLKINWQRELEKWLVREFDIGIAGEHYPDSHIVIINYDILYKYKGSIQSRQWDLLVADECHYLKNPKSKRTKMVFGKWHREKAKRLPGIQARRKLFLSGTPIVNKPVELWPIIKYLDPKRWVNWQQYVIRYCAGYKRDIHTRDKDGRHIVRSVWEVRGSSNLDELQRKLRETIMVRRLKRDVLAELPDKVRSVVVLSSDGCEEIVKKELEHYQTIKDLIEEAQYNVDIAEDDKYVEAVKSLQEAQQVCFEGMSTLRREVAISKVPAALEHIENILESEEKLVIWAHHKDVIAELCRNLECYRPVKITGDTKMTERQQAVDRFQNDPECRVFIGNIIAAGTGITLTAGSRSVFVELDWVPGNISQAEDRQHRIGQKDTVFVEHLVLEGSLDAKLAKTIIQKQEVIEKAMNGGGEKFDQELIITEQEISDRRKQISQDAQNLTDDEVKAVHDALKFLEAHDQDGASVENHIGFNKIDGRMGHSLAQCFVLSKKQAVIGKRIVKKYKRQIPWDVYSVIFPEK